MQFVTFRKAVRKMRAPRIAYEAVFHQKSVSIKEKPTRPRVVVRLHVNARRIIALSDLTRQCYVLFSESASWINEAW